MHLLMAALGIAHRNLLAHRLNRIIALLLVLSTALLVMVSALRHHMAEGTRRSITHSFVGDLQVFSKKLGREQVLFPPFGAGDKPSESLPMDDPKKVREELLAIDNVRAVVPQGVLLINHEGGNVADRALVHLREALVRRKAQDDAQSRAAVASAAAHVRHLAEVVRSELALAAQVMPPEELREQQALLERFTSDAYWARLETQPLEVAEELENRLAPLYPDALEMVLAFLGADLEQLREAFPRVKVVDGSPIPAGARGVLLAKYNYEDFFKLKSVRELDLLHEEVVKHGAVMAEDPELQARARSLPARTRDILLQLDPARGAEVSTRLRAALGSQEQDVGRLLELLFTVDDATLAERHRIFYAQVAPLIDVYWLKVGEPIVLKLLGRSGFTNTDKVLFYGTYVLEGLPEGNSVSQALNLMDPATFAELYGQLSPDEEAEMQALAADFQKALAAPAEEASAAATLAQAEQRLREGAAAERASTFAPPPVAFHAAVVLKDPSRLEETREAIAARIASADLDVEPVPWERASGTYGAFAVTATGLLLMAVVIIFAVVALLINNTTVIATLQRVQEFGTLRAMGAQRDFVVLLVLLEAFLLSLLAGVVGLVLGVLVLAQLGGGGISTGGNDVLTFFFGGELLHLSAGGSDLAASLLVVVCVTVGAALHPAMLANRVSPLRAMQSEE